MVCKRGLPIGQSAIAQAQLSRSHRTIALLEAKQDEQVASKHMGFYQ
jgi:hypothetical protein